MAHLAPHTPADYNKKFRLAQGSATMTAQQRKPIPSFLTDLDLHLFNEGSHERVYEKLGAHLRTVDGVTGVNFAVWAPNAKQVNVVGGFNYWNNTQHLMQKQIPSGIWELFVPELKAVSYTHLTLPTNREV